MWDFREKELELNKKLLARQCDLARVAETELESLKNKVRRLKDLFDRDPLDDDENLIGSPLLIVMDDAFEASLDELSAAVEDKPKEGR